MAPERKDGEVALPLDVQREQTVDDLSRHFANDNLTLDELERRIERAYRARSAAELDDLTRDLTAMPAEQRPHRPAPVPELFTQERDRILSVMTSTTRRGAWRPARNVTVWSVMSETQLDLSDAILPPGVTELEINAIMTAVRITVPPGVRVVMQTDGFLSEVSDESVEPPAAGSGAPVVRLTGFAVMSELKVRVRLRDRLPGGLHSGAE